ncbi:voltage-dependent anion channel-domain-containing protein [Xylaria acuta]|nr:voltage-dependent anion channel-domain-containing protein [Xylaria acuta]
MFSSRYGHNSDPEMGFELVNLTPLPDGTPPAAGSPGLDGDFTMMDPTPAAAAPQSSGVATPLDLPQAQGRGQAPVEPVVDPVVEPVRGRFWTFVEGVDLGWELFVKTSFYYFVANVILFSVVVGLTIIRYCKWPRLLSTTRNHPRQVVLFTMIPMALGTITTMCTRFVGNNPKGAIGVWMFWWIEVVLSLAAEICITLMLGFSQNIIEDIDHPENPTASWILPAVAPIAAVAVGADLVARLDARLTLTTIWISYVILTLGFLHAIVVSPFEIYRLIMLSVNGPLRVENIIDIFIPLTGLAQGGFAAQQLGEQVLQLSDMLPVLGGNEELIGFRLNALSQRGGFICWSLGAVWHPFLSTVFLLLSINMLLRGSFNTNWLAFTFALGAFASSSLRLLSEKSNGVFQKIGIVSGAVAVALFHAF